MREHIASRHAFSASRQLAFNAVIGEHVSEFIELFIETRSLFLWPIREKDATRDSFQAYKNDRRTVGGWLATCHSTVLKYHSAIPLRHFAIPLCHFAILLCHFAIPLCQFVIMSFHHSSYHSVMPFCHSIMLFHYTIISLHYTILRFICVLTEW